MNTKILTYSFILFSCFIWIQTELFADECSQSCKIQDGPAPALTQYMADVEVIMWNILSGLTSSEKTAEENTENKNKISTSMNRIFSVWKYYTSFDYKISLPMTQEIPDQIKRDVTKLESYSEKLTQVLLQSSKRWSADSVLNKLCEWVSNCTFTQSSARNAIVSLINNNDTIVDFMRSSLLWKSFIATDSIFILTPNDFSTQILEYYNPDTLSGCSACDGWFKDTSLKQILTISNFTWETKKWIQQWKDAWTLARGWSAQGSYKEQEAVVLARYLEEQGISTDQAWIIMWNLNRYNGGWLSTSNPLSNTANNSLTQVTNVAQSFDESLAQKLQSGQDSIPYLELTRVDTIAKNSAEISQSIATMYEEQIPFSLSQDVSTQKLQWRIIEIHYSLMRSINILSKQVPQAEKLCNKQWVWDGNCSYR